MPFKVNPDRKYVFDYEIEEGDWVNITFDFPWSEDIDYAPLRLLLKDKSGKDKEKAIGQLKTGKKISKTDAKLIEEAQSVQVFYNLLRTAIVDCEGFIDSRDESKEIKIMDDDGNVIVANQKAVFEFVKNASQGKDAEGKGINTLFEKVCLAYAGEQDSGNVRVGLPPASSTDGVQQSATPVTSEESVKVANT